MIPPHLSDLSNFRIRRIRERERERVRGKREKEERERERNKGERERARKRKNEKEKGRKRVRGERENSSERTPAQYALLMLIICNKWFGEHFRERRCEQNKRRRRPVDP